MKLGLDIGPAALGCLEQVFRAVAVQFGKLIDAHDRGVQRVGEIGVRGLFLLERVALAEPVGTVPGDIGRQFRIGAAQSLADREWLVVFWFLAAEQTHTRVLFSDGNV